MVERVFFPAKRNSFLKYSVVLYIFCETFRKRPWTLKKGIQYIENEENEIEIHKIVMLILWIGWWKGREGKEAEKCDFSIPPGASLQLPSLWIFNINLSCA